MQDIRAQDAVFASQRVDYHLGRGDPVGEIEERPPLPLDAVPFELGCLVKTRGRETDTRHVGILHDLLERKSLSADNDVPVFEPNACRIRLRSFRNEGGQTVANRVAGGFHRHPVQVRAGGGGGRRGVGDLARIRRRDLDPVHRHPEARCRHLRDLLEQSLPHLSPAVVHVDRTIRINMYQRSCLVQMGQREADAEFDRRQGETFLEQRV